MNSGLYYQGFPNDPADKASTFIHLNPPLLNAGDTGNADSIPGIRDTQGGYWILQYPLEEEMATMLVFLPEKPHGQRSLVPYSPVGHKELDTT